LFFPFWGFGVPWVLAMWSLVRLARRVDPNISKVEPQSSHGSTDESETSADISKGGSDVSESVRDAPDAPPTADSLP
jgi:hypothetical protein